MSAVFEDGDKSHFLNVRKTTQMHAMQGPKSIINIINLQVFENKTREAE
jgi:hypothetical protein